MRPIAKALAFVALLLAAIATEGGIQWVCALGALLTLLSLLDEEEA
jgi:hypothetical protein